MCCTAVSVVFLPLFYIPHLYLCFNCCISNEQNINSPVSSQRRAQKIVEINEMKARRGVHPALGMGGVWNGEEDDELDDELMSEGSGADGEPDAERSGGAHGVEEGEGDEGATLSRERETPVERLRSNGKRRSGPRGAGGDGLSSARPLRVDNLKRPSFLRLLVANTHA